MGLRDDLQRRIDRKLEEINELQLGIREAQAYVQGLQDTLKMLPRQFPSQSAVATLRPGSDLAKACDAIRKAGQSLHISELLRELGKPVDKANRAGLSGNLAAYVRRGEIFTRPAPNTFFLLELEQPAKVEAGPPEDFGSLPQEEPAEAETDKDVPF